MPEGYRVHTILMFYPSVSPGQAARLDFRMKVALYWLIILFEFSVLKTTNTAADEVGSAFCYVRPSVSAAYVCVQFCVQKDLAIASLLY